MEREAIDRTFGPAAREALKSFPIEPADVALVTLSENVTFKVTDRDGAAYVLRLHRPGYHTLAELDSEHAWIAALAAAGVEVPKSLSARDGRNYVPVAIAGTAEHGSETRYAGLARWTEGRILSELVESSDDATIEEYFGQLGTITAAMHVQSSAWKPPQGFTRHALDADGLMGNRPHWGPFWHHQALTPAERRLLLDVRDRLHAMLAGLGRGPDAYSMIHADIHPGNVLVNDGRLTVIDFDDAGFGWHQYDIATALTYRQTKENADACEQAFLSSYRAVRPMPDEALRLVPIFRVIRWMAAIGWFHERPELKRPDVFEERKNWVVEQCAALQREKAL